MKLKRIYIGIGSNLGDRLKNIKEAVKLLKKIRSIKITAQSSIYETEPAGYKNQPEFLNCVLEVKTNLSCEALLKVLQNIEKKLHRKRTIKWGPRSIDLDILIYGNTVIRRKNLIIPHAQMHKREFVLMPLLEIAPSIVHPVKKRTIFELYKKLSKKHKVKKLKHKIITTRAREHEK